MCRKLLWFVFVIALISLTVCFGSFSAATAQTKTSATTSYGSPMEMRLCVDNACENLIWRGGYYDGIKDKGADISNRYTVSRWSKDGIQLEGRSIEPVAENKPRTITYGRIVIPAGSGAKTYAEAVYTGPIATDGHSIQNGVANWKVGNKSGEKVFTLTWEAETAASDAAVPSCVEGTGNPPLPVALDDCEGPCITQGNRDLGTWVFQGNKGRGDWVKGSIATLTIQEWSGGRVAILREDTPDSGGAGLTAEYRGTICGKSIKGTAVAHWPGHFNDKDFTVPWIATIPETSCDAVGDDSTRLIQVAQMAARFRQPSSAFKCLSRAADLGDRNARTATGLMYRDGIGTKTSYPDAIRLLKQSAIQQDYNAEEALSQIYDIGVGVPANPAEAERWRKIAENNPDVLRAKAEAEAQGKRDQFMFMGLSALVEAMASPSVYIVQ